MTTAQGSLPTSEVLAAAADLIDSKGWTTGAGWNGQLPDGKLCLEGGIMAAVGLVCDDPDTDDVVFRELRECPAYQAVVGYLEEAGHIGVAPFRWNDALHRTQEGVTTLLRTVAYAERLKETQSE